MNIFPNISRSKGNQKNGIWPFIRIRQDKYFSQKDYA